MGKPKKAPRLKTKGGTEIEITKKDNTVSGKVSKVAKRKSKKASLINKLSKARELKEKIAKAKVRSQKPIVGDMDPLMSILSDIGSTVSRHADPKKKVKFSVANHVEVKKKISSEKQRCNSDLQDLELFKKVTAHARFLDDPLQAMKEHTQYMMSLEMAE